MLDIDHFKNVNDTYGHAVGDQVLVVLAERCHRNLRDVDVLARFGGEEFAILLAETDLQQAAQVAERLRAHVAKEPVETQHGLLRLTISLGVAAIDENCTNLGALLARADQALYAAKRSGRNQVGMWLPGRREEASR
jgi:diguanylate cyclase (GGDEF)-like protein